MTLASDGVKKGGEERAKIQDFWNIMKKGQHFFGVQHLERFLTLVIKDQKKEINYILAFAIAHCLSSVSAVSD